MSERQRYVNLERARILGRLTTLHNQYYRIANYGDTDAMDGVNLADVIEQFRRIVEDKP